jgi:hypothetical protein
MKLRENMTFLFILRFVAIVCATTRISVLTNVGNWKLETGDVRQAAVARTLCKDTSSETSDRIVEKKLVQR